MVNVNTGEQNKPQGAGGGRSLLDYSLVACFTLVLLLGILVLDAFEYITIPGAGGAKGTVHEAIENATGATIFSNEEIAALKKQIADAEALLAEKQKEVEKIVDKVEDEIKEEEEEKEKENGEPAKEKTVEEKAAEKEEEERKKAEVVNAVVRHETGLDKWCGNCQYGKSELPLSLSSDALLHIHIVAYYPSAYHIHAPLT
ncbi:hypothetical protein ACHAWF_006234 [Thalassiosira exigua]